MGVFIRIYFFYTKSYQIERILAPIPLSATKTQNRYFFKTYRQLQSSRNFYILTNVIIVGSSVIASRPG